VEIVTNTLKHNSKNDFQTGTGFHYRSYTIPEAQPIEMSVPSDFSIPMPVQQTIFPDFLPTFLELLQSGCCPAYVSVCLT